MHAKLLQAARLHEGVDGEDAPSPQEYLDGKRFAFIRGVPKMLGAQSKFQQHGENGQWLGHHLPVIRVRV